MAAQRSSVLREWSAWMCLLLVWVQCVGLVLMATLGMQPSATVSLFPS